MIDIKKLPKEPAPAFRVILMDTLALLPIKNASISQFQQSERRSYDALIVRFNAARQVAGC